MTDDPKSIYSETWDRYVTEAFPTIQAGPRRRASDLQPWQVLNTTDQAYVWPGDEWGDAEAVDRILQTCIFDHLDDAPARLCELASGAGRMTEAVLRRYRGTIIDCFDISREFLNQMDRRFAREIAEGRVRTFLLTKNPEFLYRTLTQGGPASGIDAMFSFDAMVHVELHSVLIYIATAAAVLKPGGLLAMNVADATTEHGFQKLLTNAPGVFQLGGAAGPQFQFASPDILRVMLDRLGFSCQFHDCNGRDLFFSARLNDPDAARRTFAAAGSGWWPKP